MQAHFDIGYRQRAVLDDVEIHTEMVRGDGLPEKIYVRFVVLYDEDAKPVRCTIFGHTGAYRLRIPTTVAPWEGRRRRAKGADGCIPMDMTATGLARQSGPAQSGLMPTATNGSGSTVGVNAATNQGNVGGVAYDPAGTGNMIMAG